MDPDKPEPNAKPSDTFISYTGPIPKEVWEDKSILRVYFEKMLFPDIDQLIEASGHKRDGDFRQDFGGYFRLEADADDPEMLVETPVIDPVTEDWDHARMRLFCKTLRRDIYENREKKDGQWHDV